MHFANPTQPRQRGSDTTNDDQHTFELSQYTPMGIQHFSAQYKNDPKVIEKLSKRICARVEHDSSDLITFCDKKIRKRRKKKKMEDERKQQQQNHQEQPPPPLLQELFPPSPEVVAASDLLLGSCLGQGSFSSVFVLEKHLYRKPASSTAPRRGRRSRLSRFGMDGTNQGSAHNRSSSNHSSILAVADNNNNNSTSNRTRTRTGRSHTPTLRRKLRSRANSCNKNDGSNRSATNDSQRSRTMSPTRKRSQSQKNYIPMAAAASNVASSSHQREINSSPIKVLRSPSKRNNNSERTRSRSLSSSIQNGIRAVFRGNSSNSNHKSIPQDEDEFQVPLSPTKTFARKSKSHHIRPQHEEDNNNSNSGRSIFRGGSRSLSLHQRRRSRRSRSRGDEQEKSRDRSNEKGENSHSNRSGVLFNSDENSSSGCSNLVVKILQPKLMNNPKLFANCAAGLIREGLFLAAIDHPNVLKVHAWTSPNGWMDFAALSSKQGDLYDGYILVLERLQGGSLKGWMRKWQREHEEEKKAIAAVAALEAAEERKRLEKSQRRGMGLPRSLSFTGSSHESNSISFSNSSSSSRCALRHTVLKKRENSSRHQAEGTAPLLSSPPSPSESSTCYFSGGSDRSFPYMGRCPTNQLPDRTSLLMQLSDTVRYLHKHRILHRDLKPDNLGVTFVDPRSTYLKQKRYPSTLSLKVFDFDIARLVPEEPMKIISKKKKRRGSSATRTSVASFDPEILNSNRSGRSVSPLRSSHSVTGGDPSTRKRTKKYRGKRPGLADRSGEASPIPTVISATLEESEGPQRDTLFEMTAKMGSPRYMAPEIARGELYNLRSEVYTVCLLVHEVLTLQKPYDELAPEDHSKLVHFDLPGYRPPIFSEWDWPAELQECLHLGWGNITHRPSMKDVHSVLKKALPKICPELLQPRAPVAVESPTPTTAPVTPTLPTTNPEVLSTKHDVESEQKEYRKKGGRSLFHRSHKKSKSKRGGRSASLTPTASNSDFSWSNDEPRLGIKKLVQ